jgi:flagellar basal body L-ring protein FlgH
VDAVRSDRPGDGGNCRRCRGSQGSDNYDELFEKYLRQARAAAEAPRANDWSWMSRLALDHRARGVNDLLTIRVVESITGSGTADAATAKASSAGIGVSSLFGIEKKLPSASRSNVARGAKANTDFKGSGATTRTGELSAHDHRARVRRPSQRRPRRRGRARN